MSKVAARFDRMPFMKSIMFQMTQEQRHAVQQGNAVRLRDPDLGEEIVVCPVALFEQMELQLRELREDKAEQEEWIETSTQDLERRLDEDLNDIASQIDPCLGSA
jgi:hypothetical protein